MLISLFSVMAISLAVGYLKNGVPNVFGYSSVTIRSPSMKKSGFNIGDRALIKSESSYKIGDIIAFFETDSPDKPITFHEIIDVTDGKFQTKGSSNNSPDTNLVPPDKVIGRYIAGKNSPILQFLLSSLGMVSIVSIPAFFAIIMAVMNIHDALKIIRFNNQEKDTKNKRRIKKWRSEANLSILL
jgi:signal peptidase I